MKVIDVLRVLNDYERVRIHAAEDLDWGDENPSLWEPTKMADIGWLFVEKVSARNVVEIASDWVDRDSENMSCLTLVYR